MTYVLVTGGAGYVGSHVCKALANAGITPVTYDNLSFGNREFVKWGPFVPGDVLDQQRLEQTLMEYRPTAVIHLASSIIVSESVQEPIHYFENNVTGTLRLLAAMKNVGCKKIVFSSTCAIFDELGGSPISEDAPFRPLTPYAESKLIVEKILDYVSRSDAIQYVSLRFFNASGADGSAETGECHRVETHLIPLAIKSVLQNDYTLKVFGADYPTNDGTAVRDYIHVADLADAHLLALNYLASGHKQGKFNLGSGKGYSVLEVLNEIRRMGYQPKFEIWPRREGDPHSLLGNPARARSALGWEPSRSNISTIIETAMNWHRLNGF
jgi:UDP-glucose-4-epimerase GalE